ncbi:MAG: super-infection exclusion protein B [Planctomycetota bacterium]|jgi:hypothetical protein
MSRKSKTITARIAKLTAIVLLGVAVAGGAILFAPATVTARLGLDAFGEGNRSSIGSVSLGASSLLAACVIVWMWVKVIGMVRERRAARGPEWCLRELTPEERGYLKPYVEKDAAALVLPFDDQVAHRLVTKGIIYPAGGMTALRTNDQPHNIQFWALRHLRRHPELLEGANARPPEPEESFAA